MSLDYRDEENISLHTLERIFPFSFLLSLSLFFLLVRIVIHRRSFLKRDAVN